MSELGGLWFTLVVFAFVVFAMGFECPRCGADLGYFPRRCPCPPDEDERGG